MKASSIHVLRLLNVQVELGSKVFWRSELLRLGSDENPVAGKVDLVEHRGGGGQPRRPEAAEGAASEKEAPGPGSPPCAPSPRHAPLERPQRRAGRRVLGRRGAHGPPTRHAAPVHEAPQQYPAQAAAPAPAAQAAHDGCTAPHAQPHATAAAWPRAAYPLAGAGAAVPTQHDPLPHGSPPDGRILPHARALHGTVHARHDGHLALIDFEKPALCYNRREF